MRKCEVVINEDEILQPPFNNSLEAAIEYFKIVIALKEHIICILMMFICHFKSSMDIVVDVLPTGTISHHLLVT